MLTCSVFGHDQRIALVPPFQQHTVPSLMSPKADKALKAAPHKAHVAERLGSQRAMLEDLSLEEDSGWRALDITHVEDLKLKILQGEYGQTTMSAPSLLINQSDLAIHSSIDGRYLLDNGKHWIAALVDIKQVYKEVKSTLQQLAAASPPTDTEAASPPAEIQEASWPEWLMPPLRKVFEEGCLLDWHKYPTDDRLAQAAVQCLSHEQDMNKFRVSTVRDKVSIVKRAHQSTNDWQVTKKTLVDLLGSSKVTTVHRLCALANGGWIDVDLGWEEVRAGAPSPSFAFCLPSLAACPWQ